MKEVAVLSYCRTGIAQAVRGALNQTHGIPLAAHVLRQAVKRAGIEAAEVEDVVLGCGLPEGATGHNIARNAALEAGFGVEVPGMTVNRYCGSGLSAASIVANRIAAGEATVAVAGGVESISLTQMHINLNGFVYPPLQMKHARGVVDDEPDGRLRGQEVRHLARSTGRVRRAQPGAGGGSREGRRVPRRDRAVHHGHEGDGQGHADEPRRRGDARPRRGPAARHDARRARQAPARVSRWNDDGRQRVAALRRRGSRRADGRRRGEPPSPADPGPVPRACSSPPCRPRR